jgi:hypothetical protein
MYSHASAKREELELTPTELFDTKTRMWSQMILVVVGVLSVIVALVLPAEKSGMAGYIYFLIGPAFTFFYSFRRKIRRTLTKENPAGSVHG